MPQQSDESSAPKNLRRAQPDKAEVASVLEEVGTLLELDGGNPFEARAYQNAARTLTNAGGDITELLESGALAKLPGMGKTLVARITEFVTTGTLPLYDELLTRVPVGLRQMTRIPGLGPKRIRQIYEALGISTLDELKAAAETGAIAALPGFGAKSQENILKGLEFLASHQDYTLYPEAEAQAEAVASILRTLPQVVRLQVAGSIRRRKEIVGDIDIVGSVARPEDRKPVMDALLTHPLVASVTGSGDTKTSVVLDSGIALDLRLVNDTEFPFLLHHFTGSKDHNHALRSRAHAQGVKINEYGIFRDDHLIPCADEHEIYEALGMAYVEPELRADRGEIEAALEGTLPHLIEESDMRGILHVHSTWSDGKASIREMAEATIALGKEYLGMCDHSKYAAYAGGLDASAVRRQHAEIDALNREYEGRLRILKGTECDILRDGTLDYHDETLATFDFVVASIHSNFNLPPEEQTQRLIRAMENPYCSILGHPTGRVLLRRDGYAPDLERVIIRAGELGVAIELNADPNRLDLDWRWLRFATDRGVRIPLCPDAHTPEGLKNVRYGIGVARKGWLTAKDVLNTLGVDELLAFFAEQRRRKGV
ncbi:MAG TPA: DNA polymerase/3'-5' exonuclease PolX [Ktedonobacterales bacterium]|nr:DNA polymerase/3'-5' exonuclease PolX [Ktedonobacterales bacterium]